MTNEVVEETTKPVESVSTQNTELPIDEEILKELHIENIQAESGNSDSETLLQQQTAQEHVVKTIINAEAETFDLKIEKTTEAQPVQTAPTKVADANPSKILNQIAKHMENLQNGSINKNILIESTLKELGITESDRLDTSTESKYTLCKGIIGTVLALTKSAKQHS